MPDPEPGPVPDPSSAAPQGSEPGPDPTPAPPPADDSGIGWGPERQPESPDDKHIAFGPKGETESPPPATTTHELAPEVAPVDDAPPAQPDTSESAADEAPHGDLRGSSAEAPVAGVAIPPVPPPDTPLHETSLPETIPPSAPPVPPVPLGAESPAVGETPSGGEPPSGGAAPSGGEPPPGTVPTAPPVPPGGEPTIGGVPPSGTEPPSGGEPPARSNARRRRILLFSAVGGAVLLAAGAVVAIILINAGGGTPEPDATPGPQASETAVALTPISTAVAVPASVDWTKTGVDCTPGLVIEVAATGSVIPGDGVTNGPNGLTSAFLESNVADDVQHAALLGRLGGGEPFFIGSEHTLICPNAAAELELGINDVGLDNNEGTFDAVVTTRPDVDSASLASATVEVAGSVAWTPTGITCVTGDSYRVSATGIVTFEGATDEQDAGPDGVQPRTDGTMQPGNVLTTAPHRGLIARVGGGDPFAVGSSVSITCPADGALEFGPNDAGVGDNLGAFTVTITRSLPALP